MQTKLEQFISEITSDFSSFAESGSIDFLSIKRWVYNELKIFGDNILELKEKIIMVENSSAYLPEDFRNLKLALKVEPFARTIEGNTQDLDNSFIYKKRIENPAYFNEVTQEYITNCNTKIVEDIVTIGTSQAKFYYNSPTWLSIRKGIKKGGYATDCLNLHNSIRNSYKNEISITNNTLNANFPEGNVYIQYYGMPTDEDGEIVIPDTKIGALEKYLEAYVKSRITENLIANNQNPQGLGQLLQLYRADAEKYKKTAMTEARWAGLGKNWVRNFKTLNQRDTASFNLVRIQ